ncbi:MAG: GTPase HflX [Bdellovibrionota bacterium]
MSRLHTVDDNPKLKSLLVGVQTPGVSTHELEGSLKELSRLVTTLGYEISGKTTQRRQGTGGPMVLGDGKIAQIARLTGGPGPSAVGFQVPNALNPKLTKARLKREAAGEWTEGPVELDEDGNEIVDSDEDDSKEQAPETEVADDAMEGLGGPKPDVVIFDCELTPSQMRNLQQAFSCEVLDRTGVIIEIFSRHAKTRAARLQVEIARLTYLAPRVRETGGGGDRGGGGVGGKGAGETALELDKRKIRDRIKELKTEFESIGSEQDTRRTRRSELRTVALVGYTNAMTGSEVYVADKLFATLDTTVRPLHPPSVPQILVSDTVGFIKKLPHDLVASFKSTLDEASNASLLLYVVDAADPSFRSQLEVTKATLQETGANDLPSILVLNKRDKLTPEEIVSLKAEYPEAHIGSTRDPEELAALRERIISFFEGDMVEEDLFIPYTVKGAIGEIRSQMRVIDETYEGDGVRLTVRARPEALARLRSRHSI